jgi:hypothetical protein
MQQRDDGGGGGYVNADGTWSGTGAVAAPKKLCYGTSKRAFVFMMYDHLDETRASTSIEISSRPASAVAEFNEGVRKHRKSSKKRRRDWRLEQWVGPFKHRREARQFQIKWARAPCRFDDRVLKGAELARDLDLNIFTFHKADLLQRVEAAHAPATPTESVDVVVCAV